MSDPKLNAAIAVTRFGLGARAGEIESAGGDPRAWLKAQVRREGADTPVGAWPDSRQRYADLRTYREEVGRLRIETGGRAAAAPASSPLTPVSAPSMSSGTMLTGPGAPSGGVPGAAAAAPAVTPAMDGPKPLNDFMMRRRDLAQGLNREVDAEVLARFQLAASTPAAFRERWALFWSNHFTVASKSEEVRVLAPIFEREAIRPHVFGRFSDLLFASTTHPGMMAYLDQTRSVGPNSPAVQRAMFRAPKGAPGLNENLAREVLELHSVGADAGYTQADVTEFARALTGLSVGNGQARDATLGQVVFREGYHEPGSRTVMGKTYRQSDAGQARAVIDDLAVDPRTARRIARKLATHFLSDDPDPALVARLEAAWRRTGGDLGIVALTLVDAPEMWAPAARKLKTPYEFQVSAWRAAGAQPTLAPREVLQPLTLMGQRPFGASQPNGWSDQAPDWGAPDAVIKRLTWSRGFAAQHVPAEAPVDLGREALGVRLQPATATALARAETRPEAFAILLMSPEFQRR